MNLDSMLKYLGGGWVVYVVMASCSGGGGSGPQPNASLPDASLGGMQGAGGINNGGEPSGPEDASRPDSPVRDANAQEGGTSACGECSIPATLRVVSPENDPERWEFGEVWIELSAEVGSGVTGDKVAEGPLVITTITRGRYGGQTQLQLFMDADGDCVKTGPAVPFAPGTTPLAVRVGATTNPDTFSGLFLLPEGQTLCAYADVGNSVVWTGYRP